VFESLTTVIMYDENDYGTSIGFSRPEGGNLHVSSWKANDLHNIAMRDLVRSVSLQTWTRSSNREKVKLYT
jgi:hypothetical protein